jgi:DNA-binding MarR family transcriptional regulator
VSGGRDDLGFLLAKASQRWNEELEQALHSHGFAEVRASYGSILVPLFEQDGLRMGEIARRARLSKQTITTMARLLERDGLIERRPDPADARATRLHLTRRGRKLQPVAQQVLAHLEQSVTASLSPQELADLKAMLRAISRIQQVGSSPKEAPKHAVVEPSGRNRGQPITNEPSGKTAHRLG